MTVRTDAGSMRLARPAVRRFAGRDRPAPTATELRFITESLAAVDREPDLDRYAAGGGNSFTRMCGELLDGLDGTLPPLDAVLLAYHLPDLAVIEVAGAYVAHRCPGDPAVFSVAGQGVGSPFTALRVLDSMRRAGTLTDGAVVVLDQSTVAYRDADPHGRPAGDCAVLVCAGSTAGEDVLLDYLDERPADDPADALDAAVRRLARPRILVGRTLADRLDAPFRDRYDVVDAPAHHLCTGAWAELAAHWPVDRYTVVADYDPHAGRLFQAGLRPGRPT
jgi:hypothetical protein